MRVLVCGGRDFDDEELMREELMEVGISCVCDGTYEAPTIVHGDARGADRLAARIAFDLLMPTEAHPADWDTYGKAAGTIRNQEMLDSGVDLVLAFPGGRGTADMVRRARKANVEVYEAKREML